MPKIVITGPESSGKTTLTQSLSHHFGTIPIPEYARTYLEKNGADYSFDDLKFIAKTQSQQIVNAAASTNLTFIDTDIINIIVWAKLKFKTQDSLFESLLQQSSIDHYLLCYPDLPWEFDPLRESQNDLHQIFLAHENELYNRSLPYTIISGKDDHRLVNAIVALTNIII